VSFETLREGLTVAGTTPCGGKRGQTYSLIYAKARARGFSEGVVKVGAAFDAGFGRAAEIFYAKASYIVGREKF
jgi:hypothetical protein